MISILIWGIDVSGMNWADIMISTLMTSEFFVYVARNISSQP